MAARRLGLARITWRRIGDEGDVGPPGPPGPGAVNGVVEVNDTDHAAAVAHNLIVYTSLSANRTVTLPALASVANGFEFIIKDLSNTPGFEIIVDPNGGEVVDLAPTYAIGSGLMESVTLVKSATQGWVLI